MAEVTELWEDELLDSLTLINVVPGISMVVRTFLINVVAELTELQKINCRDVTSIWEGRVSAVFDISLFVLKSAHVKH